MQLPETLPDWLAYIEGKHARPIDLGLDRVRTVYARLNATLTCPSVIVTGTNGKGSTTAMLDAVFRAAGYRVGLYQSPHLVRYNERVRIDGSEASDAALVEAFAVVERARGEISLTYFEFGTLAALWLFARAKLDVVVLEIGLGGRLDAVNLVDADVGILTSVALDHQDYLGNSREVIAWEKAHVFRKGCAAICAEPDPPATVAEVAGSIGASLRQIGRDFGYLVEGNQWQFWVRGADGVLKQRFGLPFPALRGHYQLGNASAVLAALDAFSDRLPVDMGAIRQGLLEVSLPGRFQVLPGRPTTVLDVGHNPHAAQVFADALGSMGYFPCTHAVFSMLGDKDQAGVIACVKGCVDAWYIAPLPGPRGVAVEVLRQALLAAGVAPAAIHVFADVASAYLAAKERAQEADRIAVFGSFHTVAAVLESPH